MGGRKSSISNGIHVKVEGRWDCECQQTDSKIQRSEAPRVGFGILASR